jgi:hypothetical protein
VRLQQQRRRPSAGAGQVRLLCKHFVEINRFESDCGIQ